MGFRVVALLVLVLAAAWSAGTAGGAVAKPGVAKAASSAKAAPSFRHVIVVFFENKEYGSIIGDSSAPRFNRLARRYASMTRFYGDTHPSLPNYIAFVSGSTQGIDSNCTRCTVDARSLADTIEESGRTWKTYAEGLPSPGFTGATSGTIREEAQPVSLLRAGACEQGAARARRPLRPLQGRPRGRDAARLLARHPGHVQLDARLLGENRRQLALEVRRSRAEEPASQPAASSS